MGKFLDELGNEVEAFTSDEVQKQIEESKTGYVPAEEVETLKGQLSTFEQEKKTLEEKIKQIEAGSNGDNKGTEDAVKKIKEELESKISGIHLLLANNEKNQIIAKLSNGDVELAKKIAVEFDNVNGKDATEKALKAYKIVADNPVPNIMDNLLGGSGKSGSPSRSNIGDKESDNSKAIRQMFGISDEDVKKYSKK